jgi:hypothetical protein
MSAIRRPKQDPKLSPSRHFDGNFTALPNSLIAVLLDGSLSPSEITVALFVARVTTGYIRTRTTIRIQYALKQTKLSRSTYLAAKRGLIEKEIIICETDIFGESIIQLHPQHQILVSDSSGGGSENLDERGPDFRTPTNKEIKKTIKTKQHQATQSVADDFTDDEFLIDSVDSRVEQEDPEILACVEAIEDQFEQEEALVESVPFQDYAAPVVEAEPAKSLPKPELTSEQFQLAQGLNRNGVNWRIAVRLAKENDPQAIQKALDGLKHRSNVKHPAGWLVEEIRAGGYAAPGLSPDALIKRTHESVAQLRQQERQQEQAAREEANQAYFERWSQFEALPFETQQELLTTARQRLARVSPKMAQLPDNSPPLRAMALELARERIPANEVNLSANQCLEKPGLGSGS